ncbi:hypothetical protein ACSVDA_07335 [Cytobacillus sp. Hm23]
MTEWANITQFRLAEGVKLKEHLPIMMRGIVMLLMTFLNQISIIGTRLLRDFQTPSFTIQTLSFTVQSKWFTVQRTCFTIQTPSFTINKGLTKQFVKKLSNLHIGIYLF